MVISRFLFRLHFLLASKQYFTTLINLIPLGAQEQKKFHFKNILPHNFFEELHEKLRYENDCNALLCAIKTDMIFHFHCSPFRILVYRLGRCHISYIHIQVLVSEHSYLHRYVLCLNRRYVGIFGYVYLRI